ncbi:unnamed protein product [Amoebophrya sp. A25]|nr:unnamed protein product [Amoebophrya sp. A25]|eukprot:GSA25T00014101001.1
MSANKFSLPPNVKGTQRGVLSIAVQEADAPVYLLWWGETREMRLTPKSIGTVFDQSSLEVPIFTSVERFISYLLDDPVIDVRVGDEVGTIDLLPFVTDTNLILDGRFRIGNLNVSLSMKTVWTNVVQPSRATAAAQGSRGFQNSPDPVNGSAADQWAALAERAEKLREDMNTRNNLPSPPYGGKDWSSSGLGLSAVAGEPTASAGGEPVLESIIASDPLHTASQVDDGAQAEQQSGSGNNLASDGVHAFNLALSPSPHVTIDLSSNSKNTSTSENASATTRIEPPQQASSTSKAIPARAVVALQWVSFRGMNVKRASVLLKGSDSIGEMVSAQSLRAQTMHVQKEVKKELVSKVYFSQEAAQRDYSRGVLSSNSPALTCKGGPAELRFEIALDTAGRSGEGTGSSLMGPYTAAASSSAAATTAEMKSRGPATVRLLHVTAYSSTSEFSALKLIENGCSAEVPVNSDCLDREEWTVPLYSGKKIVGKACMRVKLFPLKQQLQLQLGAVGNLGSLDPRSLYASYKLPNSAGKSSSRATAEIETPWMPPAHFRYSAQHAFDAGSGPGKLFLQLWQQSATDASGKTLLGLCKLQVPWPDGRMSCAASIQPVVATSGALPSIDLSLRCSTAFADELEPTTGGGTTVVGNSTARAENASSSRAAPVEDVAQEKSASAVVNNLPSSSTHVSDIAGLEGQPPVVVQQPQAAFSATTTNLPLSNATMGQQEQFGGSSGSSAFLTSGPQLASREVFRSALRGMVANAIGSDTDFLADPGQHQDPTTGGQDDDAFDLRTLEKHLTASGLARTRADAVALSNEMAVAADGERIFRDRNGGNERIPATFVREWIRRRVSPVRDALSRIVALSDDPNGLLGEVLRTLVLDRSRLLTEAEFVNLFRERFEDSISSEVGTLTVCCQEIYRSLDADSSALDAACLGGLLESFLERRQDDDFRARRGLAAFASTTPASKVKQLFKAYVFGVEALVPPAADSYRRRPSVGYVGIHESSIAYAGGSGGTSRAQQGSRLLQGTCSSKNKATSPQSRSPRTKIPFSQSAFAHLVPAKNGSKNSASSSGEEEGQQQSVGQTQRLFRLPKLERRRISVVHRKAFEHVLWEEGIVGLSQSDVRCLAEYLEPSSHRGHVNLDLLTSEIQRLGTENDDMEVEGEEGIGSPRTVAGDHSSTTQDSSIIPFKKRSSDVAKAAVPSSRRLHSEGAAILGHFRVRPDAGCDSGSR